MSDAHLLITENMDVWTTAIKKRSSQGRGSNKKIELTGIKKLRELILELAVRGKLVPQDPNDEPASVLLEKIAAEKEQLIKDKKIKKTKALPEIGGSGKPFVLPNGWKFVRLEKLTELITKGSSPKWQGVLYTENPEDILFVTSENVGAFKLKLAKKKFVERKFNEIEPRSILNHGDFLMNIVGASIGRTAIYNSDALANINQAVCLIRSFPNLLCSQFFLNFFNSTTCISYMYDKQVDNARPNLSMSNISKFVIPVPPLAEQHRIVAKVDELMALCDQLEQQTEDSITAHQTLVETLLATLTSSENTEAFNQNWTRIAEHFDTLFTTEHSIEQLKQTILQLAVMGKLVPQNSNDEPASILLEKIAAEKLRLENEEKLKTKAKEYIDNSEYYLAIPLTWKFCRLGNLAKFIDYRGKTPTKLPNGVRLITAKNVKFGHISLQPEEFISKEEYVSWMTRGIPRVGDILFTPEAPLGNVAIINIEEKFALAQRAICFQFHEKNLSSFLKIVIMSISFQNQLIENASGMTATGIKASKLKEIPIPIPPLLEQHRIVKKVNELMTLCEQLKARLNEAQTTQLHLADAVVGEVVGDQPNKPIESKAEAIIMKITTTLTLGEQYANQDDAILAALINKEGMDADAKVVWSKSKFDLPTFYKQLKKEINAGYINRPAQANFEN